MLRSRSHHHPAQRQLSTSLWRNPRETKSSPAQGQLPTSLWIMSSWRKNSPQSGTTSLRRSPREKKSSPAQGQLTTSLWTMSSWRINAPGQGKLATSLGKSPRERKVPCSGTTFTGLWTGPRGWKVALLRDTCVTG